MDPRNRCRIESRRALQVGVEANVLYMRGPSRIDRAEAPRDVARNNRVQYVEPSIDMHVSQCRRVKPAPFL